MARFRAYCLRCLMYGILFGLMYIITRNVSRRSTDKSKTHSFISRDSNVYLHFGDEEWGIEDRTGGNDVTVPEVRQVVFLKVHKAASTTVMNVFMRFGMSRDLNIMVPSKGNVFSQAYTLEPAMFFNYSQNSLYDILCCHVIYRRSAMTPYFPPDTRYIGIVRHPFKQFLSAFLYYRNVHKVNYLVDIPGDNPITSYLSDPQKYEPEHALSSFTNNRMSYDFGYPFENFNNISHMRSYVSRLQTEFDFVMVVEYFDESLVMLRRILGWTLKDILYIPSQTGKRNKSIKISQDDVIRHKHWAKLDYILYETFLGIFHEKLEEQDQLFFAELNTFRSIRYNVEQFCILSVEENFQVIGTRWNNEFTVTKTDCDLMLMQSTKLIELVKKRYAKVRYV